MLAGFSTPEALISTFLAPPAVSSDPAAARRAHPAGRGRSRRVLTLAALGEIATGLAQTASAGEHTWTEGRCRRYTRLLDTECYDAWLISWSAASSLEFHDHGGSQGVVVVATGRLVETYTDLLRRHPLRTRPVDEGGIVLIPATRVHAVSNPGPTDALSVHVYSPPLNAMTFFDPRSDDFPLTLSTIEGDLATLEEVTG